MGAPGQEHTWIDYETAHPIRPGKEEGVGKRTYYLSGVKHLEPGVVRISHSNREGEHVDVIWDASTLSA